MAIPNIINRSVKLLNGHGRNIPQAALLEEVELAATKTEEELDLGGPVGAMTATLTVTAGTGTLPTADVIVEHSHDNSTWATLGSFTQATGATSEVKTFGPIRRYIRGKATIGGTSPKFTFTLSADLDVSYV